MLDERLLTTGEVLRVTDVPTGSLGSMIRVGLVRREVAGIGREPNKFTIGQTLGLGVMWNCRRQGATVQAAAAANDWLASQSLDDLRGAFREGRRFLVLLGQMLSPRLVTAAVAFDAKNHQMATENCWPYVIADVALAFERIERILADESSTEPSRDAGEAPACAS